MPGVVVFDGGKFDAKRFAVDARLKVLRAGDVLTEAGPFLLAQSPLALALCGTKGLEQRLGGEGWLRREGVDLFPSARSVRGGLRFCA